MDLGDVQPVIVTDLLPEVRRRGTALLRELTPDELSRPTVCGDWTVHDVAAHILGGLVANVSRRRDGHPGNFDAFRPSDAPDDPEAALVATLNEWNDGWVIAGRRISGPLLADLIDLAGTRLEAHFAGIDLMATGDAIGWAGPDPAPVWLDVAREYTEIWSHFAQIREAVARPLVDDPALFAPVLRTFMHAAPQAVREVERPAGEALGIEISGDAGGRWSVVRGDRGWRLREGGAEAPAAQVRIGDEDAWRLATKGMSPSMARRRVEIEGDAELGAAFMQIVAILA